MTIWRIGDARRFAYRHWADGSVAYDIICGDTHLMEPLAMEILELLQADGPADSPQLAREMAALMPERSIVEVADQVSATLARMREAGFIVGIER